MSELKNKVIFLIDSGILHEDDLSIVKELSYDAIYDKLYGDEINNPSKIEERLFRFIVDNNIPVEVLGDIDDEDIDVHDAISDMLGYIFGESFKKYVRVCIEAISDDTFEDDITYKTNILEYI